MDDVASSADVHSTLTRLLHRHGLYKDRLLGKVTVTQMGGMLWPLFCVCFGGRNHWHGGSNAGLIMAIPARPERRGCLAQLQGQVVAQLMLTYEYSDW